MGIALLSCSPRAFIDASSLPCTYFADAFYRESIASAKAEKIRKREVPFIPRAPIALQRTSSSSSFLPSGSDTPRTHYIKHTGSFGPMSDDDLLLKEAIQQHAEFLGFDKEDVDLLWIAEKSLLAPLPEGWTIEVADDGSPYHHNSITGESLWDHPLDEEFRQMYR